MLISLLNYFAYDLTRLISQKRIKRDNVEGLQLRAIMETVPEEQLMDIAWDSDETRAKGVRYGIR